MICKMLEVRDRATYIPVMAIRLAPVTEADQRLLKAAGFSEEWRDVLLLRFNPEQMTYNPYEWGGRTMNVAHVFIREHFDELEPGSVVDVEFILGETAQPKSPQ